MNDMLIATSPDAMVEAQRGLISFCAERHALAKKELSTAEAVFTALAKAGLNTGNASRLIRQQHRRITFYEKLGAALAAGYYIIPPLPLQAFAIRTTKSTPSKNRDQHSWTNDENARPLPVGAGHYVNPSPIRKVVDSVKEPQKDGSVYVRHSYENIEFADLEFPLPASLIKPEIVESVDKALKEKIFDAIGVLPQYRSSDPIIGGQIGHWKQNQSPVTFFVTWWLNLNEL